ncbi:MAG: hypothetical protein P8Y05_15190 [Deinococcales bacterium]|jgi:hypothetical protein
MRSIKTLVIALAFVAIAGIAFAQAPAYYVHADVVRGSKNPTGPTCVLTPVFKTGEQVVWRAEVFDTATGKKLTDQQVKDLGVKVTVKTQDGKTYDMAYGEHPKEAPKIWLWTGAWVIPPVYPTGTLQYQIIVTDKAGHTVTWQPIGQERQGGYSSLITIAKR